jgi:hypothetical protein
MTYQETWYKLNFFYFLSQISCTEEYYGISVYLVPMNTIMMNYCRINIQPTQHNYVGNY